MNLSKKLLRIAVSAALSVSMALPGALALYPAKVKADALYLRKTPGGEIMQTISGGTNVAVLSNSGEWYQIAVNGQQGFVSGEFLVGTTYGDMNLGTGRITCDTTVNLREQPSTTAKVLAAMPNGASVSARGVYNGWFKVSYSGKTGYVHPDYVSFAPSSLQAQTLPATDSPQAAAVSYNGDSTTRAQVLAFAAQYLGTPYVYGGSTPSGFDCSGFTSYVYKNTVGTIPRVAQSQFDQLPRISREELLPGDLVFFGSSDASISHVGIFVGDNQFIHSPHTGEVVKYDTLTGTYDTRFRGGARVIAD